MQSLSEHRPYNSELRLWQLRYSSRVLASVGPLLDPQCQQQITRRLGRNEGRKVMEER